MKIELFTDEEAVNVTEEELNLIQKFHDFICLDIFDVSVELIPEIPFYIVPARKGDATVCIDFNCINASLMHPYYVGTNSTDNTTSQPESSCKDAVFIKTYKAYQKNGQNKTFHHYVRHTGVMCSIPGYNSYEEYYNSKYKIKLQCKTKKMIETFSNSIFASYKPIYTSFNHNFVNSRTSSTGMETFKNYNEYLVPELCFTHAIKSSLLQQLQCIPAILYRMYSLLLGEDLRRLIFGFIHIEKEYKWPFFESDKNATEILSNVSCSSQNYNNPPSYDVLKTKQNFISFCKTSKNHYGPSPGNILEALTLAKANDTFDLERYEIIGDSFLKYKISEKIYLEHKDFHSKHLSQIRDDIITNQYLYAKACEKKIPTYLIVNEFQENSTIPTCFIESLSTEAFKKRTLNLKTIADSIESLIGTCLINSGQSAAIIFMQYVGLDPFPKNIEKTRDINQKWPASITKVSEATHKKIEDLKNQNLLSRACQKIKRMDIIKLNQMTYLGNAIIGYLITRYIYEDKRDLSPGDITLIRNRIINNNLFASLSCKYKLEQLVTSMESIHMKQKLADFSNSEYFRFIQGKGYPSEDLEFPDDCRCIVRTLSDVFQGLAAILYMDNCFSLEAVWCEYFKMLQAALDFYLINLPLSMQEDLEQVLKTTGAFTEIYHAADNWHVLLLLPNGTVINTRAPQLKIAKRSAAKKAWEKLKNQKDLI